MPDIVQDLHIRGDADAVFAAISSADGLNQWWTETGAGEPVRGAAYAFGFGPGYQWAASVSEYVPGTTFELLFTQADGDWTGTRVRFDLSRDAGGTTLRFAHVGWRVANRHFRVSCHCWALYLRLLRRYVESGETVPYAERLTS